MSVPVFRYELSSTLPPLAWCAVYQAGDPIVRVRHGSAVEVSDSAFFEGAWDGEFAAMAFLDSVTCAGSGGSIRGDSVCFAAPSHTLERLFLLRTAATIYVSNSLVFALATADDDVDANYPFYHHDFASVIDGIDKYVRSVPTRNGATIEQYYCCNIAIAGDLSANVGAKREPPQFQDYEDYARFLQNTVNAVCNNAADAGRSGRFRPLTTISSGYDSPAGAVLAMRAGCTEALTFATAREEFSDGDDSGQKIGERLGLTVKDFDRTEYRRLGGFPEAEFLATGMGGEDVVMTAFEPDLPGTVLFTGFHGDKVWHYGNRKVSKTIVRGDASGGSLGEFRLRVGFIHLPIPFIGCLQHPSIDRVTMSDEMKPWLVQRETRAGRIYNRPLPRRLVEEAGVPREWFGQDKRAVTQPLAFVPREPWLSNMPLASVLSPKGLEDFTRYLESVRPAISKRRPFFSFMHLLYTVNQRVAWRLARTMKGDDRNPQNLIRVHWRYQYPLTEHLWGFHWGVERIRNRYEVAEHAIKSGITVDTGGASARL